MTKIAVVGSLSVDIAVQAPRVPRKGENLYGRDFRMGAGGKGANAATAIVRMGGDCLLVGCIGDDQLGNLELTTLQVEGVDTSAVVIVPGAPTDVVLVIVVDDGRNAVLAISQTNRLLTGPAVTAALRPHGLTLDGILINFECSPSAIVAAVRLGQEYEIPVVVDAGPVCQYDPTVWSGTTILSPNVQETLALAGVTATDSPDDHSVREAARKLLAAGPEAVVVKMGGKGALLLTPEEELLVPAFSVAPVDTTGAGDAFSAALTLAFVHGAELPAAIRYANAAGALATTRFGALEAMPTAADLEKFLSDR